MQSVWLYRAIARREPELKKRRLFLKLAKAAKVQAKVWEAEMEKQGIAIPVFQPTSRARLVARLVRLLGPRAMKSVLAAMKIRGLSVYQGQAIPAKHSMPKSVDEVGARHQRVAGGNLRAAVFGVNDGLVSNTSLIMGVAGAGQEVNVILLSGLASLLAGALSMAAGEYLSMRSQRELHEYQIDLERAELAVYPKQEAEELALIYAARGMNLADARRFTQKMAQNPEHTLDLLAREELGLNPEDLGSPWGAALFSFLSFTVGASIPVTPFLLGMDAARGLSWAGALAGISLFIIGAALSLFTGKNALYSGLRMLLIGGGAGIISYAIGHVLGVQIA